VYWTTDNAAQESWEELLLVALRWLQRCICCIFVLVVILVVLCSTILNYIYHLCALDVVTSGINGIIVQTCSNPVDDFSEEVV
jgi:uncharacterized membrane protein YqhA